MQYSANNKLKLVEGTDNVKRQDFVDNFNIIDNGLSKFYVATLNSANVYKVVTGNSLTSLNNGYSIRVAIPSNSTGAVSITVDSVTVPVKKPNGNAVTNFKANGVYTLSYYNSVFTLASGGVDDVNFSAGDLLTGKNANNSDGEKVNGTMANNGAVTSTLTAGTSYTIPAGYHNGSGKITANNLASQTSATATANQILSGQTAWVNGSKITGTIANKATGTPNLIKYVRNYNNRIEIAVDEGYHGCFWDGGLYDYLPYSDMANILGLTANKIVAGNNICGVNGTATVGSMGGANFRSGFLNAPVVNTINSGSIVNQEVKIDLSQCNFNIKILVLTFRVKTANSSYLDKNEVWQTAVYDLYNNKFTSGDWWVSYGSTSSSNNYRSGINTGNITSFNKSDVLVVSRGEHENDLVNSEDQSNYNTVSKPLWKPNTIPVKWYAFG